jgi:hypothetical protein
MTPDFQKQNLPKFEERIADVLSDPRRPRFLYCLTGRDFGRARVHIILAKDRPLTSFWFSKIDPWWGAGG